jgi:acetyl-CoA synthetase
MLDFDVLLWVTGACRVCCFHNSTTTSVVHTSVSPFSLYSRMNETNSQYIFTLDQFRRKSTKRVLKQDVAEAVASLPSVKHIFVYRRSQGEIAPDPERDVILNNVLHLFKKQHECVPVPAEHPLFVLYSTSTSSPHNGFVHSTGGYAVQAALSAQLAFDLQDNDIVGCLVDPGLIAGTTYSVYGPLLNGATTFLYGGAPGFPTQMRYVGSRGTVASVAT